MENRDEFIVSVEEYISKTGLVEISFIENKLDDRKREILYDKYWSNIKKDIEENGFSLRLDKQHIEPIPKEIKCIELKYHLIFICKDKNEEKENWIYVGSEELIKQPLWVQKFGFKHMKYIETINKQLLNPKKLVKIIDDEKEIMIKAIFAQKVLLYYPNIDQIKEKQTFSMIDFEGNFISGLTRVNGNILTSIGHILDPNQIGFIINE